jgi:hypothetical protein
MATKVKNVSTPRKSPLYGPRTGHDKQRLSPTTIERARTEPSKMVCYGTRFIQDFSNPIEIPKDIVHPGRGKQDNRFHLDVGQIKEE